MNASDLLDQILFLLKTVANDKEKLQKILDFLESGLIEPPEEPEIPEKYKKVVPEIAESIDAGFVCYLNPETLEVEDIPRDLLFDPAKLTEITGEPPDGEGLEHEKWDHCFVFEPLESPEAFKIMEQFTEQVNDQRLQEQLIFALSHRRPFAGFKNIIEGSGYQQQWFDFKQKRLENHVRDLLLMELDSL